MGMSGMTMPELTAYAAVPASEQKACVKSSKMTVAELRNVVNPVTKYYDNLPARAFIEDKTISAYDKVYVVFGKSVADRVDVYSELEVMRKVVS